MLTPHPHHHTLTPTTRRIIHRDLKPENILMDDAKNIKIADFGLAAVAAPYGRGLTQQCGTPEFAAPEIITGTGI
jgi:serine/threonine protein kinase